MKQFVTSEQLMELDKEQSDRLIGWMSNRGYYDTGVFKMSIGEMIEFLDDHGSNWWRLQENEVNVFVGDIPKDYEGSYTYYFNGDKHNGFSVCDALWEAVKEVLSQERKK